MAAGREVGQKLLIALHSKGKPSAEGIAAIKKYRPGGFSLFRGLNVDTPEQVRELTESLQRLAADLELPPFLIAADQEGGQLMAVGNGTPLPGNMALGAARSSELARKAGEVTARELAALGINVNYAPCADVNLNPLNPVIGTRSFGEDPALVGELAAAFIRGTQSLGVAATAKHFPGHGDTTSDSHHGLPVLPHDIERLKKVELPPFRAAVQADVRMVMTAHLAIPAVDGPNAPPATLSPKVINGLLRRELGFDGVVVSDALDMRAIQQGDALREEVLRAASAGVDLLLLTGDPLDHARAHEALSQAVAAGRIPAAELDASLARIARLKVWLAAAPPAPDLSVLGCAEHLRVADEIAARAVTRVRDRSGLLPIQLSDHQRVLVVVPVPQDLTPADTSSYVQPLLAASLREFHAPVDEIKIPINPTHPDISALIQQARDYDLIVVGTINAFTHEGQAELVRSLLQTDKPLIVVSMRLPYDLMAFPQAPTFICAYSILEPCMRAAAGALFGQIEMTGRLPVSIPGIAPDERPAPGGAHLS